MNKTPVFALFVIVIAGAALGALLNAVQDPGMSPVATGSRLMVPATPAAVPSQYDYARLRQEITYGYASLADARRAMTDRDPVSLSNSIHALFAMRKHRGVIHLLDGMWHIDEEKYPELSWNLLAKAPVRIALASTINRIRIIHTEIYQSYIRSHRNDPHEFNRAQVVVALGFNGDLSDLPYLKAMSDGDNHYVAQSAITGLSLFGGKQARNVLIELAEKHEGSSRGDLMKEMLARAYRWPPPAKRLSQTKDK